MNIINIIYTFFLINNIWNYWYAVNFVSGTKLKLALFNQTIKIWFKSQTASERILKTDIYAHKYMK